MPATKITRKKLNHDLNPKDIRQLLKLSRPIDKTIMSYLMVSIIYGTTLKPLKLFMLKHPLVMCLLDGSYLGLILSGHNVEKSHQSMWFLIIPSIIATISSLKFFPMHWLMGKYWGDTYLELTMAPNSRILKYLRKYEKESKWHHLRLMVFATIPFTPIPLSLVNILLGNSKTSLKFVAIWNFINITVVTTTFSILGYYYGTPVSDTINKIGKNMNYLSIVITVVTMFSVIKHQTNKRKKKQSCNKEASAS